MTVVHSISQGIQDKKLKGQLRATEKLYGEAATSAAKVEQVRGAMLPEPVDRESRSTQHQLGTTLESAVKRLTEVVVGCSGRYT